MIGGGNITEITHFILLGFSDFPRIIVVLFVVFLVIYILTLTWNLSLLILIRMDSHLHTPMYFFLSNLSFMDICYVTSTAPKMLYEFFQRRQIITYVDCVIQNFIFSTMGLSESCLMTAMAYDRYAAICNPLLYSSVMSPALCGQMVLGSYLAGLSATVFQLCAMLQLHFCGPNVINHFFCEILAVLKLACGDISLNALILTVSSAVVTLPPLLLIFLSYVFILTALLRVPSAAGRHKAFSTCSAHLTVVVIFYGTLSFMYFKPKAKELNLDKLIALFYGVVTPSLNPIIYSLRKAEVKAATIALLRGDLLSRKMSRFPVVL